MAGSLVEMPIVFLLAWTSGISLYLSVALAGIFSRAGWLDLPGKMEILENPLVIAIALFVFTIEFVADKVPVVDTTWDAFHTFIRPVGGAVLGVLAATEYGPVAQTVLGILSGTLTMSVHATKASSRLAINTSPEPFSNILASFAENFLVVFLFWVFIMHPYIATAILVLLTVGAFFLLRMLWRFAVKLFNKGRAVA
jgi:hypothetical protein